MEIMTGVLTGLGVLAGIGGYHLGRYRGKSKQTPVQYIETDPQIVEMEDPVEVQCVMELRKYFARIAHGLLSFHQTRNTKALAKVGRELRDEYTWYSYYLEERSMDTHRLRDLYLALEQLDHARAEDVDAAICDITDLARELEDIVESYATDCGISPMIRDGYIRHLMAE